MTMIYSACTTNKQIPALSEAECLGSGRDGVIRVKAWGYGRNTDEAVEQAKRNAVQDVLFKGVKAGQAGCPSNPIVPGGIDKAPDYFREFFKDGGDYLRYISLSGDGSIRAEDRIRVGRLYKIGVFVVVDHRRLRQRMQDDGLAPRLTDGF